jgi:hypothetical protein
LVVTNAAVYNIHKKEVKRKILISDIGGLTKTVPPSKSQEFTIHVPSTYDYRFQSPRRDEIIDLLKRLHLIEKKANCPIYHVQTKDLKEFTTTEKDMKKKQSRIPTQDYRCLEEDLHKLETPSLQSQMSTTEDTMSKLEDNQRLRSQQLGGEGSSHSFMTEDDSQMGDTDGEISKSMTEGSTPMMKGANPNAKLQDFQIKKMIGRGTFGKVYIVEHTDDGKLYAMKCIRKDLVLEN